MDREGFKQKPDKKIIPKLNDRLPGQEICIEIEELAYKIGAEGHTFTPAVFNGSKRTKDNVREIQLFCVDMDGGISYEEVKERAKRYHLPIAFAYSTFSSTKDNPKFRMAFIHEMPLTNMEIYSIIIDMLLYIFPEADKSCRDPCRIFFGGKGLLDEVSEQTFHIVDLAMDFQRYLFEKDETNYIRNLKNFARKHDIQIRNNCLKIHRKFGSGENDDFLQIHPYIYGSASKNSSDFEIMRGYQTSGRKEGFSPMDLQVDLKSIQSKCRLFRDFLEKDYIDHNERFMLMTNLIHIRGGRKLFLQVINEKGYDRKEWRFYVKYAKNRGYYPSSCEGVCPYCDCCNHKKNMALTVKDPDKIVKLKEEDYRNLAEVEQRLIESIACAVANKGTDIQILPAQTALGKTEQYCRLVRETKEQRYIIAVPTVMLKNEISRRLKQEGVPVENVLSMDDLVLPEALKEQMEACYARGLNQDIRRLLLKYIKKNKRAADAETARAVQELKKYLSAWKKIGKSRVTVMTHARLALLTEEMIKGITVIIDEDILSTFFKQIITVSLSSLKKCADYPRCPYRLRNRFQEILNAGDMVYESFQGQEIYDYLEAGDLDMLQINENVNDIAFASCFYREGDEVHYFYPLTIPKGRYFVFSATADAGLYRKYFKGRSVKEYPYIKARYKGRLKQFSYYSMSRQCIKDQKDQLIPYLERYEDSHVMITFLKYEEEFSGCRLHFGNAEGHDFLKGKNVLVLGTPHLSEFVYKLIGCHLGLEVSQDALSVRRIESHGYQFNLMTYRGTELRELQLYFIYKELEQCIGRARLLRNDCEVLLFSNVPCEQAELNETDYLKQDNLKGNACSPDMAGKL